jgi:hypothetical protein
LLIQEICSKVSFASQEKFAKIVNASDHSLLPRNNAVFNEGWFMTISCIF